MENSMDKCQFCGKPATVHMTQIVNSKTTVIRMCNECAAKHGFFSKNGLPFALLSNLGEMLFSGMKAQSLASGLICSKCGCTPMSFKETGRLGCPNCYKDLKPLIDNLLESFQKGTSHKGKKPKNRTIVEVEKARAVPDDSVPPDEAVSAKKKKPSAATKKIDELKNLLEAAVKAERYEEAAKLRDEIKNLTKPEKP
jgi:protein arginine kinase activator